MFVGRVPEIDKLETALLQTRAGNPVNFMITGERGIGKSSLLNYLKDEAEGMWPLPDDAHVKFLVIDTDIAATTTEVGLLRKIELGMSRRLASAESARAFLRRSWEFLQRLDAGGIGIKEGPAVDPETLLDQFAYSMAELVERLCSSDSSVFGARYDGVIILIDEADNASPELALGSFLKLLTERLNRRGCDRVCVGLAGLPELRNVLARSHASSLRLFEELPLGRLSEKEVRAVVDSGIRRSNADNSEQTAVDDDGMTRLAYFSEGYPHFIQQFAHSAFAVDQDGVIDEQDVLLGAFGSTGRGMRGALELIGDRYYKDPFYTQIQTDSYRQVLRIMADNMDGWVTKQKIKEEFRGKESTLDNALHALRERKIILSKEGVRGVYRLQHKGFAWWIKMYATDPASVQKTASDTPATEDPSDG